MTDTANAPERDDELLPCPFCGGEAWYNIDHTTELCNSVWCRDCDFGVFDPNGTGSSVAAWNRRTHCDELVAAAYLDAAQRIEQCLWSQHWYIDGESVDPEDLSEDITKRTPDDARTALTAYGERMKAEGAKAAHEEAFARGANWAQEKARVEGRLVIVDSPELAKLRADLAEAQAKIARLTEALAIAGPIALKEFDSYLLTFIITEEEQRQAETIRAALQENANG